MYPHEEPSQAGCEDVNELSRFVYNIYIVSSSLWYWLGIFLFYLVDVWRGGLYLQLFVVVVVRVLSSFV